MHVIDVMASDFFRAKASALQHYKPGSTVAGFRPLSEEELQGLLSEGGTRKWIPLHETHERTEELPFPGLWPDVERVNYTPK